VHTPLTEETRHMISDGQFAMMKKGVRVVNCARGGIIDEAALVEALKRGKIAGAAIDTHEYEPEVNPELCGMPNVVLTPHIASSVKEVRDDMARMAAQNIIEALTGRTPPNLVRNK